MKIKFITSVLLSLTLANAKLIYIIRHGEKLNDKVTNLSPKGEARASCLINVFGNNGTLPSPQKIYAQNPTEKKQSTRPKDTVIPLSDHLGLELDLSFTSGKVKKLANDIMSIPDDIVLVSWSNDKIPDIAEELGIANAPDWDNKVFDDIWVLSDGNTVIDNDTMNNDMGNTMGNTIDNSMSNTNGNFDNMNANNNINENNNNNSGQIEYQNNNNSGQIEYSKNNNSISNNKGNNSDQYVVNSNFKRSNFNMEIIKQDINQCISGKMAVIKEEQKSSDSNSLRNSALMVIFSLILSVLVYIY